jgi:uncharacterized membrane protein
MSEIKKAKYLGGIGAVLIFMSSLGLILFIFDKLLITISVPFAFIYPCALVSFIFGFISLLWAIKQMSNIYREKSIFHNAIFATFLSILGLLIATLGAPGSLPTGFTIVGLFLFLLATIYFSKTLKGIERVTKKKIFLWSTDFFLLSSLLLIFMPLVFPLLGALEEKLTGVLIFFVGFLEFLFFPLSGPPLFWALGFLLLAIAFFTLPEALSQKSLTEKKEA